MEISIRTATEADAPALRRYAERLFGERPPGIYRRDTPSVAEEVDFIRSRLTPANSTTLVAEDGTAIIGLLDFAGGSLEEERHTGSFGISVDRDYRAAGIGSALIERLLAWAPTAGITRVEVRAWSNNPRALALYRRLGFREEGCLKAAITSDGQPVDVIVLARLLGEEQF